MKPLGYVLKQLDRSELLIILFLSTFLAFTFLIPDFLFPHLHIHAAGISTFISNLGPGVFLILIGFLVIDQGFKAFYPITEISHLDLEKFINNLNRTKRIRVMETFTALVDAPHWEHFKDVVTQAVTQGTRVEILLAHPDSTIIVQRSTEIGEEQVKKGIKESLARFYELSQKIETLKSHEDTRIKGSLDIRLYKALPFVAMYMWEYPWDSRSYVNCFPLRKRSDDPHTQNLVVPTITSLGQMIMEKFDELWSGSETTKTVDISEYMRLCLGTNNRRDAEFHYVRRLANDKDYYYVLADGRDLIALISDVHTGSNLEEVTVTWDGESFQAKPHKLNHMNHEEELELELAASLIKERYEWDDTRLYQGTDMKFIPGRLIIVRLERI